MSSKGKPQLRSIPGGKSAQEPRLSTGEASVVDDLLASVQSEDGPGAGPAIPTPSPLPSAETLTSPPLPNLAPGSPAHDRAYGRYELLMQLGTGGMATVYLARIQGPQEFEKLVAIKRIHDHLKADTEFLSRFRHEARVAALIHHPNVVETLDVGTIDGAFFIATEYVHGQTLRDVLNAARGRRQPLSWPCAVRIVADVARGLHAAHELRSHQGEPLGVVHRDVSPQNVLVGFDGKVKLGDFGINYAATKLTDLSAKKITGKVSYMSPEQALGADVDRRSDIFSLAAVLFEAVTHRRLFKGETEAETLQKVREAEVPFITQLSSELPGELDVILQCALAVEPDARFDTAEDFARALDELLQLRKLDPSSTGLAETMQELFADRKQQMDQLKRRALANVAATPLMGIEAIDDEASYSTIFKAEGTKAHGASTGLSPFVYIVGTAGVILLAVLVAVLAWPKGGDKKRSAAATPPPAMSPSAMRDAPPMRPEAMRQRPASRAAVLLTIRVSPRRAKATIKFRGEVQKGHVFQAVLPPSDKREVVTITAKGYETREIPILLTQKLTLPVELERESRRRRRRRRRRRDKDMERPRERPMSMLIDLK